MKQYKWHYTYKCGGSIKPFDQKEYDMKDGNS